MKPFNQIVKGVTNTELCKIVADCNEEVMISFTDGKLQSVYKTQLIK